MLIKLDLTEIDITALYGLSIKINDRLRDLEDSDFYYYTINPNYIQDLKDQNNLLKKIEEALFKTNRDDC